MASTKESGHAKNVTNLETLITYVIAFGASYNPSKESLRLEELQTLLSNSKNSLSALYVAQSHYSNAVAARESSFENFGKLITRVNNALKATDTTVQVDESAQTIVRKIQGKRASAIISEEDKKLLAAEGKEINQISTSQMSYDSKLENLDKLIALLSSVPQYSPNEEDLKIDSLKIRYNELRANNLAVLTANIELSNARISRNEILYKPLTGLVDIAFDTKVYIKSVFGASSPQFKQISKLSFTANNL